jgi:hypothetical protein
VYDEGGVRLIKSLAQFAPAGANKIISVFSGGVYVGENTSQTGSVRAGRLKRTASARTGLHPLRR